MLKYNKGWKCPIQFIQTKLFTTITDKTNYNNKYNKFLTNNMNINNNDLFSKYVKIKNINNYNFFFYGILHGQIQGKSSSGKDCSELINKINPHYIFLELCETRLNKLFYKLSNKDKINNYQNNNYSKFTYLPRIHNGFMQDEYLPILEKSIKNKKFNFFLFDRNINTIKNRLDYNLLYDTKSYKQFFNYCIESIALRHYTYDIFIKLYKDYDSKNGINKNNSITEIKSQNNNYTNDVNSERKQNITTNSFDTQLYSNSNKMDDKAQKGDYDDDKAQQNGGKNSQNDYDDDKAQQNGGKNSQNDYDDDKAQEKYRSDILNEDLESLNKLNLLNILNERLNTLSKSTYHVLIDEKVKYGVYNIWCSILNNETNFFENQEKKNIIIICNANILEMLTQEFDTAYFNIFKKYTNSKNKNCNNTSQLLIFENPYNSYNDNIKPHWPLIFIKYYIIPYFILYFVLNTSYNLFSWIYKSNFQTNPPLSHNILDIKV
ncbi:conserved Plasmodium protein, unknown function [Plasmodium yoelii]|nr:conserved Plasmodium protein, unknown function [Plasmodium yoelii]WBY61319.1 hypothetical protein Py17XNL_001401490 [Plasmodium yoelii yoelii]CDU21012.1 conserved Plasmodium protein, unknown function, fragment [Plasmodium yoelii]VTZ81978.1 conserved Plasmodium protein, unknown function [Plasmodium yoelii]|eukprot:XP_729073.2 conserved Plasmodium protein, unknown function [Plasmodium yoelii]